MVKYRESTCDSSQSQYFLTLKLLYITVHSISDSKDDAEITIAIMVKWSYSSSE